MYEKHKLMSILKYAFQLLDFYNIIVLCTDPTPHLFPRWTPRENLSSSFGILCQIVHFAPPSSYVSSLQRYLEGQTHRQPWVRSSTVGAKASFNPLYYLHKEINIYLFSMEFDASLFLIHGWAKNTLKTW